MTNQKSHNRFTSLFRKFIFFGTILSTLCLGAGSCCVEEFPNYNLYKKTVDAKLNLNFSLPLPLLRNIDYSRSNSFIVRHQVWAFRQFGKDDYDYHTPSAQFTFFDENPFVSNYSFPVALPEGKYKLAVFTDFIFSNRLTDHFYNTAELNHIALHPDRCGNSEYRDCFSGCTEVEIKEGTETDITMERPLSKYVVIATDVQDFYTRILQMLTEREGGTPSSNAAVPPIDLNDYTVSVTYPFYLPSEYDLLNDTPVDSSLGISYQGKLTHISPSEIQLAFDYVFVNHHDTSIDIIVKIIENATQEVVSSTPTITVPLSRSHLTIVKGNFLTSNTSPGMSINPNFNGDYNIEIK